MRHAAIANLHTAVCRLRAVTTRYPGCLRCLHAHASQPGGPGADLFAKGRVHTLERSIGGSLGRDADLWRSGAFHVSIYPDLPAAMTWADLFRQPFRRSTQHMTDIDKLRRETHDGPSAGHVVRTIGIQLRGQASLRRRILLRAGLREDGSTLEGIAPADGLLLVSGSHPARGALRWTGMLQDSRAGLKQAAALKRQGLLPRSTALWAVANPLVDAAASLERKVAAGAEAILTQPPLLWPRFESWYEGIERMGLQKEAKLVIGIPMLTSARSLRFWLQLCSAGGQGGAAELLQTFADCEARGPEYMHTFCSDFMAHLISKVLDLPDVAGLHVMPVSGEGRRLAARLMQQGSL